IAALLVMEKAAHGAEKVKCGMGRFCERGRHTMAAAWPVPRFFYFRNQCQPGCHVVIAHASWTLLYVRFQMEDCAAIFRVAIGGQIDQSVLQFKSFASD